MPKIHTLFRTYNTSILVPCFGQLLNRSCMKHPYYKQDRLAQIMHTVYDRVARNCIPCLGQTCAKSYTLFTTSRTKTIPCPAAHPPIDYIREYSPPRKTHTLLELATYVVRLNYLQQIVSLPRCLLVLEQQHQGNDDFCPVDSLLYHVTSMPN